MSLAIPAVEIALLTGELPVDENSSELIIKLVKSVIHGAFHEALTSAYAKSILKTDQSANRSLHRLLNFKELESSQIDGKDKGLIVLILSVAFLHAFVQSNWTGPDISFRPIDLFDQPAISEADSFTEEQLNSTAIAELACGGEPAYHLAAHPVLLRFAQILLSHPYVEQCPSASWWRLRASLIHQQILDEPSPEAAPANINISVKSLLKTLSSKGELLGQLLVEHGRLEHQLSRDRDAAAMFLSAAKATGLEFELTGALGKRTKFQQTEISQLVLLAESHLKMTAVTQNSSSSSYSVSSGTPLEKTPETLALNDDTLLERTEFTSSTPTGDGTRLDQLNPSSQPPLHPLDQCILLSLCLNVKNTSPAHGLTTEQMAPYVARVISHPLNWSIHTMALLLRSRLEAHRTRTMERSTLQLQALIDQMPTADSALTERLRYYHSIPLPSKWEMERELALRFLSLGVTKSALEIFERLEMWEEVVKCWQALERRERGVAIIKDLLEGRKAEADTVLSRGKSSTAARRPAMDNAREAKLWCILGDLEPENAVEHYKYAWSVSGERSARAMRSLGGVHFSRGNFAEAIPCLERAVAISPINSRPWFVLGCACLRVEDWERARRAFVRCVSIDEEDGESWNNLASIYLRLGDKSGKESAQENDRVEELSGSATFENKLLAFRALKQGIKVSYDNWRMWANYMLVAMDVGELAEACRALGRLVEERAEKDGASSVDEDVLDRLVRASGEAFTEKSEGVEAYANPSRRDPNEGEALLRRVLDLLERIILPRVQSPRIFRAYARLLTTLSRWDGVVKAYLDSYRCGPAGSMQRGKIDTKAWREAVVEVEEIVGVLRNFGPRTEDGRKCHLQARSIVRTFMGRSADFEDEPEWARLEALQEDLRNE